MARINRPPVYFFWDFDVLTCFFFRDFDGLTMIFFGILMVWPWFFNDFWRFSEILSNHDQGGLRWDDMKEAVAKIVVSPTYVPGNLPGKRTSMAKAAPPFLHRNWQCTAVTKALTIRLEIKGKHKEINENHWKLIDMHTKIQAKTKTNIQGGRPPHWDASKGGALLFSAVARFLVWFFVVFQWFS